MIYTHDLRRWSGVQIYVGEFVKSCSQFPIHRMCKRTEQIHDHFIITNVLAAIINNNKWKAYHAQEDRTWSSHGCLVQSHHNSAEFLNKNEPLIVNSVKQCTGIVYASMLSKSICRQFFDG